MKRFLRRLWQPWLLTGIVFGAAVAYLLVSLMVMAWIPFHEDTQYFYTTTALERSPDLPPDLSADASSEPSRLAVARAETVSGPGLAATYTDYAVYVVDDGQSLSRDAQVLFVEGNTVKFTPILHWLTPHKLQIVVPNDAAIASQKTRYNGIDIEIKFNPDDPPGRARVLRLREERMKCGCDNPGQSISN